MIGSICSFWGRKQVEFCDKKENDWRYQTIELPSSKLVAWLNKVMHLTFNPRVSIIYDQLLKHEPGLQATIPNDSPKMRLPIISKVGQVEPNGNIGALFTSCVSPES